MAFFAKMKPKSAVPELSRQPNRQVYVNDAEASTGKTVGNAYTNIEEIRPGRYIPLSEFTMQPTNAFAVLQLDSVTFLILASPEYAPTSHEVSGVKGKIQRKYKAAQCVFHNATVEIIRLLREQYESTVEEKVSPCNASEVENFGREIIEKAIEAGASDIHIETRAPKAELFFRVNGARIEQPTLSAEKAKQIANVWYNFHADASSKNTQWYDDRRMDTSIAYKSNAGIDIQLRFSSVPIFPSGNVCIVIRVLKMVAPKNEQEVSFDRLGYTQLHAETITDMLVGVNGLVLLVGPTNSGKSTSMRTFVRTVQKKSGTNNIKVLTVEDPVEYIITDACQIGVSRDREDLKEGGESVFQGFLKATLRQDPDVVIIGEIRDTETATIVKDLVLSGRKIISTLHAFSAFAAFPRLKEIGVPPSVLYMDNFLSGVIYQRLVPTLCPHCSIPILEASSTIIDSRLFERLTRLLSLTEENIRVKNIVGCEHCDNTGISGRTLCAEVVRPDKKMLALLKDDRFSEAEKYWRQTNMIDSEFGSTALAHAISKMRLGQLDPADVESQVGILRVIREQDPVEPQETDYLSAMRGGLSDDSTLSNIGLYKS